jgi:hypothetical protein
MRWWEDGSEEDDREEDDREEDDREEDDREEDDREEDDREEDDPSEPTPPTAVLANPTSSPAIMRMVQSAERGLVYSRGEGERECPGAASRGVGGPEAGDPAVDESSGFGEVRAVRFS